MLRSIPASWCFFCNCGGPCSCVIAWEDDVNVFDEAESQPKNGRGRKSMNETESQLASLYLCTAFRAMQHNSVALKQGFLLTSQ